MKALTAPALTRAQRPGAQGLFLCKIEFFKPAAKTLYVSDRYVSNKLGQQWLPLVEDFGNLQAVMNTLDAGGRPAQAELTFMDTVAIEGKNALSELIWTPRNRVGTYYWDGARVTVYWLFPDLDTPDVITLHVFFLQNPSQIGAELFKVRMTDWAQMLEKKGAWTQLSNDSFPEADPDDVGKDIPVPFGELTGIPTLAAIAGARSTLMEDITATVPGPGAVLKISDAAKFPIATLAEIDDEQLEYTGCVKVETDQGFEWHVTVARRGVNGRPTSHKAGAAIWEIRSGVHAYGFIVCENKPPYYAQRVSNVRVAGVLQTAYTVEYNNTTLLPGKSFVVIWFAAKPILRHSVDIQVDDTIAVNDTIAVSSPTTSTVKEFTGGLPRALTLSGNNPFIAFTVAPSIPAGYAGALVSHRISINVIRGDNVQYTIRVSGGASGVLESGIGLAPGVKNFAFEATKNAVTLAISTTALPAGQQIGVIFNQWDVDVPVQVQVNRAGAASKIGTVAVTGNATADVVIGGDVTCDLKGLQDDDAGTITGIPHQLLTVLADQVKVQLETCWPGVTLGDLGTTWAATRDKQAGLGRWDYLLTSHLFSDWRKKVGQQGRANLYLEAGKFEYKFRKLDSEYGAIVLPPNLLRLGRDGFPLIFAFDPVPPTIIPPDLIRDYRVDVLAGSADIQFTPDSEVYNDYSVFYGRDYRKTGSLAERYRRMKTLQRLKLNPQDATEPARDPIHRDLELDLIQDAQTAEAIGNYELGVSWRQRIIIGLVVFWNTLQVELYDLLAIINHPRLVAFGGSALVFAVTGKTYRLTKDNVGLIDLTGVEINNP